MKEINEMNNETAALINRAVSTHDVLGCEKVDSIDFASSGLDWELIESPLFNEDMQQVRGWRHLHRSDCDHTVHVCKDSYGVVQNHQLWSAMQEGLAGVNYTVSSAGCFKDSRRVFIKVDLDEHQDYMVNGDKFRNSMMFVTAHDGTMQVKAYDCSLRMVCMNQMRQLIKLAGTGEMNLSLNHTKNVSFRMEGFGRMIEQCIEKRDEYYTSLEYLNSIECNHYEAQAVIASVLHPTAKRMEDVSTRSRNAANDIYSKYYDGIGNKGETMYDLLNGFTERWTHENNGKDSFKNYIASEHGSGAKRKSDVMNLLVSDNRRSAAIERGKQLLATA